MGGGEALEPPYPLVVYGEERLCGMDRTWVNIWIWAGGGGGISNFNIFVDVRVPFDFIPSLAWVLSVSDHFFACIFAKYVSELVLVSPCLPVQPVPLQS